MATRQLNTVILTRPDDWENWYNEMASSVVPKVWEILDPEAEHPREIMGEPERPRFQDFRAGTGSYAELNQAERKDFNLAYHIYEGDLKEFRREEDQIQKARERIQQTISDAKKALLSPGQSVRQWLCTLKEATKPTNSERRRQLAIRYRNTVKPLLTTNERTVIPWLEEWETVMALGIRIGLPEALNEEIWLLDFEKGIEHFGKHFISPYTMELMRDHKTHTFSQVASDFRRWYSTYHPSKQGSKPTVRGSAFETRFAGEGDQEQGEQESGTRKPQKRQRASTTTGNEKSKRKITCPACDGVHALKKCWIVMEEQRPEDWTPSQKKLDRLEKRVQENPGLAKQIENAKRSAADEA